MKGYQLSVGGGGEGEGGGGEGEGDMSVKMPAWLERLMGETFFGGCGVHQDRRKNEKNVLCLHCCLTLCPHCLPHHATSHSLLQVLFSSHSSQHNTTQHNNASLLISSLAFIFHACPHGKGTIFNFLCVFNLSHSTIIFSRVRVRVIPKSLDFPSFSLVIVFFSLF